MKIEVKEYTKKIKDKTILSNINLNFESGRIYGLHGRNGSGKTMLLRAISGLILPTSGSVFIDNKQIGKDIEFPENIGIIIENMKMHDEYTAFDNLKILAKINHKADDSDICKALEVVGLNPNDKKKIRAFSLGMKQKVNIAQAIMENPKLLLLDEPTNALDEESVNRVRNLLLDMRDNGTLIIIASHNREDLDMLCNEVIEIHEGQIKK